MLFVDPQLHCEGADRGECLILLELAGDDRFSHLVDDLLEDWDGASGNYED